MKITIITAVFNGSSEIKETLDSVANQDYGSIEHIVIDGGSTDDTVKVIEAQGRRVACLLSEKDEGVYDAFNKGLRMASGDVIAFLNCGDTYADNRIVSRVVREFAGQQIKAVFGDVNIVDAVEHSRVLRRYSSGNFTPSKMAWGFMPAHPALFLARSVYNEVGEFKTDYSIAGDFELCLRVFCNRNAQYVYLPIAMVRMRHGGLSNRGWRSVLTSTREMRRACATNGIPTNFVKLLLRLPLKYLEVLRASSGD